MRLRYRSIGQDLWHAVLEAIGFCTHNRVTWPRRGPDGRDYVTCLNPYCQKVMLSSIQFGKERA